MRPVGASEMNSGWGTATIRLSGIRIPNGWNGIASNLSRRASAVIRSEGAYGRLGPRQAPSSSLARVKAAPYSEFMDAGLLNELINRNQPFQIETASGRIFDVPHRDFVAFTPKRTSLFVTYVENDEE